MPTTHILKPAIAGFDDHDLNEHLCLRAARLASLYDVAGSLPYDDMYLRLAMKIGSEHRAASADAVVALGSSLPERMVARITEHADRCLAALAKTGN